MSIFVQMTCYRGFDLLPTVHDCIKKAKDRDSLHFGICLQQDEETPPELGHERIRVERVPLAGREGHGWARSRAQSLYGGQDYTLQIDSGCRFVEGWDEILKEALLLTGSRRPIVTNPANRFNRETGEFEAPNVAYRSQAFQFVSDAPSFWPVPMKNLVASQRARQVCDHFFFTEGRHCVECPYDPGLYYSEFESALTLRSFTLGYDLFHHFRPVVFRDYGVRPMPWGEDAGWWEKDRASKRSFQGLLSGSAGAFGLGGERSLRDFELYSGIDFAGRRLQKDTVSGLEPPCAFHGEERWEAGYMRDYLILAVWDPSRIEDCDDLDYWFFAVEDASGAVINRQDLRWERDRRLLEKREYAKKIFFRSLGSRRPARIAIQPFSKSRGGLARATFAIP